MQHHVLQDFYKNPTQPKHCDRTEYGVLMNTQDALDSPFELLGHQHAV